MRLLALILSLSTFLPAQTISLSGTVQDAAGSPVPGVEITLLPSAQRTESDAEGRFRFSNLVPGEYQVTVTGKGFVPAQRNVQVNGATSVALTLSTVQTSIEVRAERDDFLATTSVSITKSPLSLLDLPTAVQVIPKALLEDRQIQDIKDLYRNISGVSDSPYSAMTVRGFTQREVLFNGVRGNPYGSLDNDISDAGFSTSQGRLSNVEFVEVLKGPAAVLYGGGEPGGLVNFVTKKPRNTTAAELSFRTGSFQQRGGHGELTGPLWKQKNLFYRAAWFQEDRDTFRWNTNTENIHAAAGLSWKASEATSLGFEYEYVDQQLNGFRLRGTPVNSAGQPLAPRDWVANEPTDFSGLRARVFQTRLDHAFTATLRTDITFRYLNFDRPERYHDPRGINANGTMRREFRDQYRANQDYSVTWNAYARWTPFGLKNNLTFGTEFVRQDWTGRFGVAREVERGGPVPALSLLFPVYGTTSGNLYRIPSFTNQAIDSRRTGFFLQDQIELTPRLQLVLGGRIERFSDQGRAPEAVSFDATAYLGRIGAVYRILPNLSAFATVSNAYTRPPSLAQVPSANGPHDAETGRQYEIGGKTELSNGRVLITTSLFHIEKDNVLRPDPAFGPTGANFIAVLPIGKVRNRGIEFDATGRITRNLSVIVNYAYLDSRILQDRFTPTAVGRALPNAARHAFGLFARYDINKTGTSLTLGNESRSRRFEPYANFPAAGYGIWDLGLFQKIHRFLELRAQLDNAFDESYALASLFAARAGNMPGAPRTLTVSLHFRSRPRQ